MTDSIEWLAGLIEGEGCFTIQRRSYEISPKNGGGTRHRRYPNIVVGMTDRDVIERVHRAAGVGVMTGPIHLEGRKTQWRWRVWRKGEAVPLMKALYPYMGERRRARIDEVLALCAEEPVTTYE